MALLKNRDYGKAFNRANKYLVSDEFKPLLAQAVLFYNSNNQNKSVTAYLDEEREASFYEYLASALDNDSLLINAALLWAKKGEIDKAFKLLRHQENEEVQEAIALLAYDSGRESEALIRLLDLPYSDSIKYYNMLLIADLFYLKDNWPRSRYYYEEALKVDGLNPYAYINIASIYKLHEKYRRASTILQEGIDLFSDRVEELKLEIDDIYLNLESESDAAKKDLSIRLRNKKNRELKEIKGSYRELVLLYFSLNRDRLPEDAVRVLQEFRIIFPEDVKIELLLMKSLDSVTSPEIFEAKLWKLLNTEGERDSQEVSEYLIWYFLGLKNYKDVNLVLERYSNRNPDDIWPNYYKGIISALDGQYDKAFSLLDTEGLKVPDWELLFNKGVIEKARNNSSDALTLFNKSLISLNSNNLIDNRDIYRSLIKTKIAEVLITLDDVDEAIRVLNQAIELDPNNYRSDLLKSIHLNIKERG